jgi:4-hydroxy-3-polyprenylbenzoate decarboxylase
MSNRDLREWLEKAKEMGELKLINGANWDEEIGRLMLLARNKQTDSPAILFDNVTGYPKGYRVLTSMLSTKRRLSMTAHCSEGKSDLEFVDLLRRKMRDNKLVPPKVVQSGPLLQNVQRGKDIDLFKFPVPKWYPYDGGRYIGTGHAIVTRDPDDGWVNIGCYRTMVFDKNTVVTMIEPGQHGRLHREKYFTRGKPMPAVIIAGGDPILHMVGSMDVAYGVSEYDYIGGLAGAPMEVIEGPATGLPVPANAEVAIEVEYLPDEVRTEGPIREFTGTYSGGQMSLPAGRVLSVMHRNEPILCGRTARGRSLVSDGINSWMVQKSASLWNQLEMAGIPGIKGVWCHPMGTCMWVVVSLKQMYRGHVKQAGLMAATIQAGNYYGRYVIVVDEDINPTSDWEVIWALSMRSDPVKSIDIIRDTRAGMLDPAIIGEGRGLTSKAIIDATVPFHWSLEEKKAVQRSKDDPALIEKLKQKYGQTLYE